MELNKQSAEWAVLIITFIFASIAIFLRLHSRHLTKAYFWWDDAFAICCYVSCDCIRTSPKTTQMTNLCQNTDYRDSLAHHMSHL